MNSDYKSGFAHTMKVAGLEKTAINTRLLKRLLDVEHPNAPVSAERLMWGRRTGDWDDVPANLRNLGKRFSPFSSEHTSLQADKHDTYLDRVRYRLLDRLRDGEDVEDVQRLMARLDVLEESRTVNAAPTASGVPDSLKTIDFNTGELINNPNMFNPDTRAFRGKGLYGNRFNQASREDAVWTSGHPDIAAQYAKGLRASQGPAFVFEYDVSKIAPKDQGPWQKHLALDSRGMTQADVSTIPIHGGGGAIGNSPYYEKVVTEGALRPALTKRWRPTKDGGLELMEDFAKSKGKKPEF